MYGVKYHFNRVKSGNRKVVHSFELHSPHLNPDNPHKKWHWQLNRWNKNKHKAINYWRIWGKEYH